MLAATASAISETIKNKPHADFGASLWDATAKKGAKLTKKIDTA